MVEEKHVSFETAKLLKDGGFDGICRSFWKEWDGRIELYDCTRAQVFDYCSNSYLEMYNGRDETNIAAPTLQMVMDWMITVHHVFVEVDYGCHGCEGALSGDNPGFRYRLKYMDMFIPEGNNLKVLNGERSFKTRGEAVEAAITRFMDAQPVPHMKEKKTQKTI